MKGVAAARAALLFLGLFLAGPTVHGDGPLLVIQGDDGIVFTNTPSRGNARPVTGFSRPAPKRTSALPPTLYDSFIERTARANGLSPRLVKAVVLVESGANPHAVSPKGAMGLMQLMPETARRYGVADPFDPLQNIEAGTRHLRDLLEEFDGDERLALAAYNAGSGAVRRAGGVPNYPETLEYIRRIDERMGRLPTPITPGASANGTPPRKILARRLPDGTLLLTN